jgi:hypothetical protein
LGLLTEPESLSCLRRRLLPEFRFFLASCPGERLSRDDRIIRLQRLHNAATALPRSLPPVSSLPPRKYLGHELLNDQLGATIGSLADDGELYPTWHPLPRSHSFPEDADSERLLDSYFEPRLGPNSPFRKSRACEEPGRRKAGNADAEFIPPPHKRRSTDRGIVARITAQVSGEQQS